MSNESMRRLSKAVTAAGMMCRLFFTPEEDRGAKVCGPVASMSLQQEIIAGEIAAK